MSSLITPPPPAVELSTTRVVARRVGAVVVDLLLLGQVFAGVGRITLGAPGSLLGALTTLVVLVVGQGVWGTTPGKALAGLRVERSSSEDGQPPGIGRATLRNSWIVLAAVASLGTAIALAATGAMVALGRVSGLVTTALWSAIPLVLLAGIVRRPDRRGLHDRVAGTSVRPVAPPRRRTWILAGLAALAGSAWLAGWWFGPTNGSTGTSIGLDSPDEPIACDLAWDAWYAPTSSSAELVLEPGSARREVRIGPHDVMFDRTGPDIDFTIASRSRGSAAGSGRGTGDRYQYTKTGDGLGTFHMVCTVTGR